jgi:hypothetical protein
MKRLVLATLILATPACDLYQEDDKCDYGYEAPPAEDPIDLRLRDPYSGQCQYFGYPNPTPYPPCDPECGPCPGGAEAPPDARVPIPSWGMCNGVCEEIADEALCLDSYDGCRAAYLNRCPFGTDCDAEAGEFIGCWATDQTGPQDPAETCSGLDAFACSLYQDCVAIHANTCQDGNGQPLPEPCYGPFEACAAEPVRCSASAPDCGAGMTCDLSACQGTESGDRLVECQGVCVPDQGPVGDCYGDVFCDSIAPECPPGTLPGISEGCYTGYCIPEESCEGEPPACTAIQAEATCVARSDCSPFYEGVDCSCTDQGCTCAEWNYVSCDTLTE